MPLTICSRRGKQEAKSVVGSRPELPADSVRRRTLIMVRQMGTVAKNRQEDRKA